MNSFLISLLFIPAICRGDSIVVKTICLPDPFEDCIMEYQIPVPAGYTDDSRMFEGGTDRLYIFHYSNNAKVYIVNDGEMGLNYRKLSALKGFPSESSITGNIMIPFGWKDVPKEIYDDDAVPRSCFDNGKCDDGYWADYQTPHINVGFVGATNEQLLLFLKTIIYVIQNVPNNEVYNIPNSN